MVHIHMREMKSLNGSANSSFNFNFNFNVRTVLTGAAVLVTLIITWNVLASLGFLSGSRRTKEVIVVLGGGLLRCG
jgi:hypothetical protein